MITQQMEVIIDFETFSELDLKRVSAYDYAQDASIICVGYKINDQPGKIWIPERGPMPDDLWYAYQHAVLLSYNAGFERMITKYTLTRYDTITKKQREFLETIPVNRWRCIMAKAAACSLARSLENVGASLNLPLQKDKIGSKLIKKYCKPRKPSKNNPRTMWNDKWDLRRIYRYCITDLEVEYDVHKTLPNLSDTEQKVWELDQKINERGILIDIPLVHLIIGMIKEEIGNITLEVRKLSKGKIDKATQTAKVLEWVNARGAGLPNLQAATVRDYLEDFKGYNKEIDLMLEYRQACSKTSTAKYKSMIRNVSADNRARETLLYAGAVPTLRMTGKRIQLQNFPRPTPELVKMGFTSDEAIEIIKRDGLAGIKKKYGKTKAMDVFASCIRGMLIPDPGNEFFQADFSQVEARLAFWFAYHEEGLQAFRDKRKIYEEMAAFAFGMNIDDVTKESLERFVGKESVLGCQYGMGAAKFLSQCHKKDMKKVDKDMSKKAVDGYRKKHWPVPETWTNLETAIVAAIRNPGKVYHTNRVDIYVKGRFLLIKIPGGRKLRYFKPRVSMRKRYDRMVPQIHYWTMDWVMSDDINPKTGKPIMRKVWCEIVCWGGIFFNHIVQGCARDLMMRGIERIEDAGYKFLLSVHDEGVSQRKKGCGNLKEYIKLMSGELPSYMKGAPIVAEGWQGMRYKK